MTAALALVLPCRHCGAQPHEPCVRGDGQPASRNHGPRRLAAPCGTYGGYQRHKKAGEESCAPCREANRRYTQERRRDRPDERQRNIDQLAAWNRALKRLRLNHIDEFADLVAEEVAS